MKRQSFQNGSVVKKRRPNGYTTWVFRYRDGDKKQRAKRIGTLQQYPTKADAERQALKLRLGINGLRECFTMAELLNRYELEAIPERQDTAASYRSYLKRIRTKWGVSRLDEMSKDIVGVERWLNELRSVRGAALSKKTRAHIKALLHRLFECAMRWGCLDLQRNPMALIELKGSNRRVRALITLTLEQYEQILGDPELPELARVMVQIAMCLGMRASEILGLREEDIDFTTMELHIRRSMVGRHEGETKTEASEADLPLHPDMLAMLTDWVRTMPSVNGWLFESPVTGRPFHRDSLQSTYLVPAGKRIGVSSLGWHAFRHSYRSFLDEEGIPMQVQQLLMRHSDIRTTLAYGKTSRKHARSANAKVVEMIGIRRTA